MFLRKSHQTKFLSKFFTNKRFPSLPSLTSMTPNFPLKTPLLTNINSFSTFNPENSFKLEQQKIVSSLNDSVSLNKWFTESSTRATNITQLTALILIALDKNIPIPTIHPTFIETTKKLNYYSYNEFSLLKKELERIQGTSNNIFALIDLMRKNPDYYINPKVSIRSIPDLLCYFDIYGLKNLNHIEVIKNFRQYGISRLNELTNSIDEVMKVVANCEAYKTRWLKVTPYYRYPELPLKSFIHNVKDLNKAFPLLRDQLPPSFACSEREESWLKTLNMGSLIRNFDDLMHINIKHPFLFAHLCNQIDLISLINSQHAFEIFIRKFIDSDVIENINIIKLLSQLIEKLYLDADSLSKVYGLLRFRNDVKNIISLSHVKKVIKTDEELLNIISHFKNTDLSSFSHLIKNHTTFSKIYFNEKYLFWSTINRNDFEMHFSPPSQLISLLMNCIDIMSRAGESYDEANAHAAMIIDWIGADFIDRVSQQSNSDDRSKIKDCMRDIRNSRQDYNIRVNEKLLERQTMPENEASTYKPSFRA